MRKLDESYLNVWFQGGEGQEVEDYIKPVQFYNLKTLLGIISVVDVELVTMPQNPN